MIEQQYEIEAPIYSVWEALTEADVVKEWTGAPAEMNGQAGAKFSLWGGDIYGTNLEVTEPTLLKQEWYGGDWDEPSIVTIKLSEDGNSRTVVSLLHEFLPANEVKNFAKGWKDYYFVPIKDLLED